MTQLVSDGIWTWFAYPYAWYDSLTSDFYVGTVTSAGDIQYSRYFGGANSKVVLSTKVNPAYQVDDHAAGSGLMMDNGKTLIAYSKHDSASGILTNASSYGSATNGLTGGITTFNSSVTIASGGQTSYPEIMQLGDTSKTIYLFFRNQGSTWNASTNPNYYPRWFSTSTDHGSTFSSPTKLIDIATFRPYAITRQTGASRVDFFFSTSSPSDSATCSLYHAYMTVASDGTRSFFKSDGTSIGGDASLPLTTSNTTLVYDGTTTNSWTWDMQMISGTLYVAFTTFNPGGGNTVHTYHRGTLSAGSWSLETVCNGGDTTPNYLYSPEVWYSGGICLDPNDSSSVYVSRSYGAGDFRLEKWTKSGSWAKAVDISGNTGSVNARPQAVKDSPSTQIVYWRGTYTSYTSYNTSVQTYPDITLNTAWSGHTTKPSSPAWQSGFAPAGIKGYWPFTESSGGPANYAPSGTNGTLTGAPTWASGSYGRQLGSFSTTKYVAVDPVSQYMNFGTYPFWVAVMFVSSDVSGTQTWIMSQGSSSAANPTIGLVDNYGASNQLGSFIQDNGGTGTYSIANVAGQTPNDGNAHVMMLIAKSASDRELFWDGNLIGSNFTNPGANTITNNLLTFGALRRTTVASPFGGSIIAVAIGSGGSPDPGSFADDWMSGTFAAVRDPVVGGAGSGNLLLLDVG